MYLNSNQYTQAIKNDDREIIARVTINDVVYDDEMINNIEFTSSALAGEQLAIGSTHENAVSIVFSEVINILSPLDKVVVEMGVKRDPFNQPLKNVTNVQLGNSRMGTRLNLWNSTEDVEFSLMGEFYISDHVDVNYNDKITTIECKDKMIFMEDLYESQLSYPADIRDVIVEIANSSGVEIDSLNIEELDYLEVNKLDGYTYRQALGYLAQLLVGYVYFSRKGYLQIRKLVESNYQITTEEYYSKGLTKNGIRYKVQGITCTVPNDEEPNELFVGSRIGTQLSIENPLMTQSLLQSIFDELQGVDYYPYDLEWRGNPSVEVGDLVTVYDVENNELKVPNLNYQLTYSGGLTAKSSADSKSQTDIVFTGRQTLKQQIITTQKRIKETADNLTNAFQEAQDKITGNQGGYIIQRMNDDGKPYEFLVMDTEDIHTATNVIRLNQQGIGFSQNGYNGPFGVAITIDGQIVADYITAGTLSAELIQSGFNDIAFGTSITQEGIKQVDANGEYAIMANGGLNFYTANDILNGSIESSYQTGGETGVGIFIHPGRRFSLVRNYFSAESNVTIVDVTPNEDELRLRRNMNAYGWNVYDAGSFRARNDIHESVFRTSADGFGLMAGESGSRLGYLDNGAFYTTINVRKEGNISFNKSLDLNQLNINDVNALNFKSSSSDSTQYIGGSGTHLIGGDDGVGLGSRQSNGAVLQLFKVNATGAHQSWRDIDMSGHNITNTSDVRLKSDIKPTKLDAIREIKRWQMIDFTWRKDYKRNEQMPDGEQFGISAQSAPSLQIIDDKEDSYLTVNKTKQIDVVSLAVQQLIKKVEELEGVING